MQKFCRSYAVLQRAQQLLVVLVVLAYQPQQQQVFQCVAALLLFERSRPALQPQRPFFAPTAAAAGASAASSYVVREAAPAAAAERVFTEPRRDRSGRAAGGDSPEQSRYTPPERAAAALTSEPGIGALAKVAVETRERSRTCSKPLAAARPPQGVLERFKCVSAIEVFQLPPGTRIPSTPGTRHFSPSLLLACGFPPKKTGRAPAGAAASICSQVGYCNLTGEELFSRPYRTENATQNSLAAVVAPTASPAAANGSFPAIAVPLSLAETAGRFASFQATAKPRLASIFAEKSTSRVASTFVPFTSSKRPSRGSRIWRTTAPATAGVAVAALLLPCVAPQSTTGQQEQVSLRQVVLRPLAAGKKEDRMCSRWGSKSHAQSDTQHGEEYSACLCPWFCGSDRVPGIAAPRNPLVRCPPCRGAGRQASIKDLAAESVSPSGARSSSVHFYKEAARAARNTGAADRTAAACSTTCSPVPLAEVSAAAATAEETPVRTVNLTRDAPKPGRGEAADASARHAADRTRLVDAPVFENFFRTALVQFKTLCTSQVEAKPAADRAAGAAAAAAAGEEALRGSAAATDETIAALQSAAAAVRNGFLKLAESLSPTGLRRGTTGGAAAAQQGDDPPGAGGEKKKPELALNAAGAAHAKKAAAALTPAYFCQLRQLAFLDPGLQRYRSEATGKKGEAPEGVTGLARGGLQGCRRREMIRCSCSGCSKRKADAGEAEKSEPNCRRVPRFAAPGGRIQKSLAWLFFWRKKEDTDKDTQQEMESGGSGVAATNRDSSERDDMFAAAVEIDKEVRDKAAEEARRQAFRSPVVAAVVRFWEETPKFTRFYLSTAFTLSLLSSLYGQSYPRLFSPAALLFNFPAMRERGQLHRLITSLFFFGPLSLPTLLSLSFVHAYLGGLEQHFQRLEESSALYAPDPRRAFSRRRPSRFPLLSLFSPFSTCHMFSRLLLSSAAAAMTLAALKQIPNEHLLQCISTSLLHVWSRVFPSGEADFYGLFTVSNEYLPFFFLAQNWLFEGRIVAADLYGIGIAALWLLLVQQRLEEEAEQQQQRQQPAEQDQARR